jgi:hypothetical protein
MRDDKGVAISPDRRAGSCSGLRICKQKRRFGKASSATGTCSTTCRWRYGTSMKGSMATRQPIPHHVKAKMHWPERYHSRRLLTVPLAATAHAASASFTDLITPGL